MKSNISTFSKKRLKLNKKTPNLLLHFAQSCFKHNCILLYANKFSTSYFEELNLKIPLLFKETKYHNQKFHKNYNRTRCLKPKQQIVIHNTNIPIITIMKDYFVHMLSIMKQPLICHCCKEIIKVLASLGWHSADYCIPLPQFLPADPATFVRNQALQTKGSTRCKMFFENILVRSH